jgi:hypothetical protein
MWAAVILEGLLLDKRQRDDLRARLQDSVRYLLGRNAKERVELARLVGSLYDERSEFVHGSSGERKKEDRPSSPEAYLDLAARVIQHELRGLP